MEVKGLMSFQRLGHRDHTADKDAVKPTSFLRLIGPNHLHLDV